MNPLFRLTFATLFCAAALAQPTTPANADEGLQRAFEQAVYSIASAGHGAWRSENRAQRFQLEFDSAGTRLTHSKGHAGFRLTGYGYGERIEKPAPPRLQASANRLDYQRGNLTESYVNGPQGLEQSFTFGRRPGNSSNTPAQPLEIALAITGDLNLSLRQDAVLLSSGTGVVLRCSGLAAFDARGRAVPSRMELRGRELRLLIEDGAAQYPLTVDPTWSQQAEFSSSDGVAYDQFGYSVAISGDIAIIGAPSKAVSSHNGQGAAYVFVRSGGTWTQQAELVASDGAQSDSFGFSVAIDGATAVIGAYYRNLTANGHQGVAYVFVQSGVTWTQQAELTASDAAVDDFYGISVAVSGETAVIGALRHKVGSNNDQGAAYVYVQSGVTWTQQAELTSADGAAGDAFGQSVAVSGGTALVGADEHKVGSQTQQGAAYVYVQSGVTWSQQAELLASDGVSPDQFGISVALSGDTALIGADYHQVGTNSDQGAAYVFVRSGVTWTQQTELTSSDGAAYDNFGYSVSLSGNTAGVGVYNHDVGSNSSQGVAYVFVQAGSTWTQFELIAADGAANDQFGNAIAVSATTVIATATLHTVGSNSDQGAAYVYVMPAPTSLSISATHLAPLFQSGPGTITLTVSNSGTATVDTANVSDTIDSAFTINSVSPGCMVSMQTVTCTLASGTSAASTAFNVYVTVSSTASASIFNTATLTDATDSIATSGSTDTIAVTTQAPQVDSSLSQTMLSGSTDNGTCAAGNRTLTATDQLQNTSGSTLTSPYAVIGMLNQGDTLLSQSASPASVVAGGSVTFTFHIQLVNCNTFRLLFDVRSN